MQSPSWIKLIPVFLAIIGLGDTIFISGVKEMADHFCGAGSSCEAVLTSSYSQIFGISLAKIGTVFYTVLLLNSLLYIAKKQITALHFNVILSLWGSGASVYFIYLQAAVIEAWCPYCLLSAGIQFVFLGVCWFLANQEKIPLFSFSLWHVSFQPRFFVLFYGTGFLVVGGWLGIESFIWKGMKAEEKKNPLVATIEGEEFKLDETDIKLRMRLYEWEKQKWEIIKSWYELQLKTKEAKVKKLEPGISLMDHEYEKVRRPITQAELEAFYKNRYTGDEPLDQVGGELVDFLRRERYEKFERDYIKRLERKYNAAFHFQKSTPPYVEMNIREGDASVLGDLNAPLQIVEFSDFECPQCREIQKLLKEAYHKFPDLICVVYRHYPLEMHKNAESASKAALAARLQGKFWEYSGQLFEAQNRLGEETYIEIAKQVGLNLEQFNRDRKGQEVASLLKAEQEEARRCDVQTTPVVFFNGVKSEFKPTLATIEKELKKLGLRTQ